jgi:hypothetical protein
MNEFTETHQQLANPTTHVQNKPSVCGNKWQDRAWWSYYVEATYHALCANPREILAKTKKEIAEAIFDVNSATIFSWISALRQAATDLGDYEPAIQLAALVEAGISAIESNKLDEAFKLFDVFDILNNEPRNLDFEDGTSVQQIPIGWIANGNNYQFGVDAHIVHAGQRSGYLKSTIAKLSESGRLIQIIKAEKYLGQRVRFSGYVKSKGVEEWAGLWMRIDGRTSIWFNFDDMRDRPITDTTDWQEYDIVLDVPKESSRIAFGIQLRGKGQLWVDDLIFEIVSQDKLTTDSKNKKEPQNLGFGQGIIGLEQLPMNWYRTGSHPQDYIMGVDKAEIYQGKVSACLKSRAADPEGNGSLGQSFQADNYIGKRLRMSAYVKSKDVENWTGLWLSIWGTDEDRSLSFDGMHNRPITGTTDWQRYQAVLDVPEGATSINFGVSLIGKGQVWVNDFQLEVVSQDVPTTDLKRSKPTNLDFEQGSIGNLPGGWFLAGNRPKDYITGIDSETFCRGLASGFLRSKVDKINGFGTLMQEFNPENYRNQRLRMSAFVKSKDVVDWCWLWMRVDGPDGINNILSFDNMQYRPIKGTTEWLKYEIVLDVPQESTNIGFGVGLSGIGQVWVDDFKFEVVSTAVPVTGMSEPENFTEAIQLNRKDATAFYRRAIAYVEAEKYEQALADCNEAIRLNPKYSEAISARGWIYMKQGKYEQSIGDLKKSIRLNPKDASTFYDLASAYALQRNLKDTLTALRRCLEIDERKYWFKRIPEDTNFDYVRTDPRFHALIIEFSESS